MLLSSRMLARLALAGLVAAAILSMAGCGASTAALGPATQDGGLAADAATEALDSGCVPTDAMCIVNSCGQSLGPTCVAGEWMCPDYNSGRGCVAYDSGVHGFDSSVGFPPSDASPNLDAGTAQPDADMGPPDSAVDAAVDGSR